MRWGGGLRGKGLSHKYNDVISVDNLFLAWRDFARGKRGKREVQTFSLRLADNILALNQELTQQTYQHSSYRAFRISDPKPRQIHKANVRDRVVHRAIYRILYPYFHSRFIYDSYSCRNGKGTHKAVRKFADKTFKLCRNNTKAVWVLKCDIRKFFASIDQEILLGLLKGEILDKNIFCLIEKVVCSFNSGVSKKGLPLGNLTSQLFANIYLSELDQFMKHQLKARHYLRYADDFVIIDCDQDYLLEMTPKISDFLAEKLKLELHPNKVFVKTIASGVDFLGWVNFPRYRVLRTVTKRRMLKRLEMVASRPEVAQSYLGMLTHGNGWKLKQKIIHRSQSGGILF